MGGQEYLICLFSCQTLPCLQNTGIQDEETAEYFTMSVSEDEEKDISEENKQHQDTCPVKTLVTVSLLLSPTALVISCVFGSLVMIRGSQGCWDQATTTLLLGAEPVSVLVPAANCVLASCGRRPAFAAASNILM